MAFWEQRTLNCYTPTSTPELTFFYVPVNGLKQAQRRQRYSEFEKVYEFLKEVFCEHLLLFSVEGDDYFGWPSSTVGQGSLLAKIPRSVVIEVGASILGWKRIPEEKPEHFVSRIIEDLKGLPKW